jgi:hypothetical protein
MAWSPGGHRPRASLVPKWSSLLEDRIVTKLQSRLETLRVGTDHVVETVIACGLIDRVVDHFFRTAPQFFSIPYYNTPLWPMLSDHADASVIRLAAVLDGTSLCKNCRAAGARHKQKNCVSATCEKTLTDGIALRGLEDLKNHRDVLGHPLTFQLSRPGVVRFVAAKRHYADARPALVWDIHRSIVDAQVAAGTKATVLDITPGAREVIVAASMLRPCWCGPKIEDALLLECLRKAWTMDRVAFENHPDGQFPRKTDEELDAIYEKEKAAWERSRLASPPPGVRRRPLRAP